MASAFICEECPRALECVACRRSILEDAERDTRSKKYCSKSCAPVGRRADARERSRVGRYERTVKCKDCHSDFVAHGPANLCAACVNRRSQTSRTARAIERKSRICERCGLGFVQGSRSSKQIAAGSIQKYCSRRCALLSQQGRAEVRLAHLSERDRARARKGLPPVFVPEERSCSYCIAPFIAKTAQSRKCEVCASGRKPKLPKACVDCGEEVLGTASKKRCGKCARRASRASHALIHGRTKKHRQRARKFGVDYEPVNPLKVFDRDGWRCQLCGVRTPKKLRGSMDDRAPELDHIHPMAAGGAHSYANTHLACRRCNIDKGARPLGQLLLFG